MLRLRLCGLSSAIQQTVIALVALLSLYPTATLAQESGAATEGVNRGNYNIQQTFEFGYRWEGITGSRSVYNTFVNLNPGPRLFEQSLNMRSLDHQGLLFDDFSLFSFGYGGDPNNVTRLRVYKNKWYNFSGTFRRDRNYWDYNLLANPLNPTTSNPAVPIPVSPHRFEVTRRMTDYNLILAPQSRVRVRLGYSRNISEGPSLTTPRLGTEVAAFQSWKTFLNAYQLGVDFKFLPRTSISYDQFLYYYKGDTTWQLQDFPFQLSDGTPVSLGLIFNTPANQPCAVPVSSSATTPPTASATCNGFLGYSLAGNFRTNYPTEQISIQSRYFRDLDFSGRFSYSSADADLVNFNETIDGRSSRTNQRIVASNGPASTKRVTVSLDLGATWFVTNKFRVVDSFRFNDFRIPGFLELDQASLFGGSMLVAPNIFTPGATPPSTCPTITSAGCPQHTASSPADNIRLEANRFLGQETKSNLFELEYDFTRRVGGRIGYRFTKRAILHRFVDVEELQFFPTLPNRGACATEPLLPDGSCEAEEEEEEDETTVINEHSLLLGVWLRPADSLRMTFDLELMSADNVFTRVSPRQRQQYKFRANYKPVPWANISGNFNILESRNNVEEIFHTQHNRTYAFAVVLNPRERFAFDFGYDFNDVVSNTNICYTLGAGPLPPGSTPCPVVGSPVPISGISRYTSKTHYGYFGLTWKPVKRVTTGLGYAINSVNGDTTFLSPNVPVGPLQYNWHKPYANLEIELSKYLSLRSSWGFYGYNEKASPDPFTAARDFRGNLFTTSARFVF